jgi:cell filamentation protein
MDVIFDIPLVLKIHRIAFGHIYEWAGKWRNQGTNIGIEKEKIPYAMAEYAEQVEYFKNHIDSEEGLIDCLFYAHHRLTLIHPFNNGNDRTA